MSIRLFVPVGTGHFLISYRARENCPTWINFRPKVGTYHGHDNERQDGGRRPSCQDGTLKYRIEHRIYRGWLRKSRGAAKRRYRHRHCRRSTWWNMTSTMARSSKSGKRQKTTHHEFGGLLYVFRSYVKNVQMALPRQHCPTHP